jgi:hypothetical protein
LSRHAHQWRSRVQSPHPQGRQSSQRDPASRGNGRRTYRQLARTILPLQESAPCAPKAITATAIARKLTCIIYHCCLLKYQKDYLPVNVTVYGT